MTAATRAAETLAKRRGRCRLCHEPILPGVHYLAKHPRFGWCHSHCTIGHLQVIAEHDEPEVDDAP